jgi:hypothetical protein
LIQATAGWQGIASQLGQALLRGVPVIGVAPEAHVTGLVEHAEVVAPGMSADRLHGFVVCPRIV